jgi:hypothetical protein
MEEPLATFYSWQDCDAFNEVIGQLWTFGMVGALGNEAVPIFLIVWLKYFLFDSNRRSKRNNFLENDVRTYLDNDTGNQIRFRCDDSSSDSFITLYNVDSGSNITDTNDVQGQKHV